jgi:archaeal flagellar protein FlaJ
MVKKKKSNFVEGNFEKELYSLFMPITRKLDVKDISRKLSQSDSLEDVDYYLSKYMFYAFFISGLFFILGVFILSSLGRGNLILNLFFFCIGAAFIIIVYSYIKPFLDVGQKVSSIKNNLALTILSMSSIAESGAPPEAMFLTTSNENETPCINKEFKKITNYMDNLGLSLLEAIEHVCNKTPSIELKKFLTELKSNIESGGSISEFMKKKAEHAQFQYHLMLDNMNQKAETFGDIYSAVVIAGPLFLFSTVMLLGMIGGGGLGGVSLQTLLVVGIFLVIPIVNIVFLIILQMVS